MPDFYHTFEDAAYCFTCVCGKLIARNLIVAIRTELNGYMETLTGCELLSRQPLMEIAFENGNLDTSLSSQTNYFKKIFQLFN